MLIKWIAYPIFNSHLRTIRNCFNSRYSASQNALAWLLLNQRCVLFSRLSTLACRLVNSPLNVNVANRPTLAIHATSSAESAQPAHIKPPGYYPKHLNQTIPVYDL